MEKEAAKTGQLVESGPAPLMETRDLEVVSRQFKQLQQFIAGQMKKDVDFGIIPGTKKKTLYKPGAEKLLNLHGLAIRISPADGTIVDFKAGFFHYNYKAEVFNPRTGVIISTSEGSCNSKESKYAYEWVWADKMGSRPTAGLETKGEGSKLQYRVPNDDPYSLVNTIQKMAQKRAMVGATLLACRASDIFSTEEDAEKGIDGAKKADAPGESRIEKDKITEPKLKRLFALVKEGGKKPEELEALLRQKYAYTVDAEGKCHSSWISFKHYDEITEWAKPGSSKKD